MIHNYLSSFESWVETFETHEFNVHGMETVVTVDIDLFPWEVHLSLRYFIIANTTYLEPNTSEIHQMT